MGVRPARRRTWLKRVTVLVAVSVLAFWATLRPVETRRLRPREYESLRLFDRHGIPLGESLTEAETSASWTPLEQMSPDLPAAAVAAEDRRFYSHHGLDFVAIGRAFVTNLRAGRARQGASTITQQVARMILADEARDRGESPPRRTLLQKLKEAHLAFRLEHSFSKRDLLEAWLNRMPMGGVSHGVTSGANRYFGVHPSMLSLEQSAVLVGLPRGPSALKPQADVRAAKKRRNQIITAMETQGLLSHERAEQARRAELASYVPVTQPLRARLGAWVAKELISEGKPVAGRVTSTIDRHLEQEVTRIVRKHIGPLKQFGAKSAAVVVIDHTTDELLALIGSVNESDPRWGQVHAAFALRQPGSALKPFVYLAALEKGKTNASLASDVEQAFPDLRGAYLPTNYDKRFHGPVRYRDALAQSLNVAAVDVLRFVNVRGAADILERAGISTISRQPEHYGLGLTLGSLDVQLLELTEAYATLARGGIRRPTQVLPHPHPSEGARVIDAKYAFLIADVLSDPHARAPQFGFSSVLHTPYWTSVKTGTSKGFRDNFTVGFSRRYTVGVWVGDPEGQPMQHVSGVAGAGPIWRGVMDLLHEHELSVRPEPPPGVVKATICPLSGLKPGPHCAGTKEEWFAEGTEPTEECGMHQHVALAKADGLPVPPGCKAPASEPRPVTLWPSPFDTWAVALGKGVADTWTSACPPPPETETRPPKLLAPAIHEIVKIDPQRPLGAQQMLLLADAGKSRLPLEFFVDGVKVEPQSGPHAALWSVTPGEHRITARRKNGQESAVHTVVVR